MDTFERWLDRQPPWALLVASAVLGLAIVAGLVGYMVMLDHSAKQFPAYEKYQANGSTSTESRTVKTFVCWVDTDAGTITLPDGDQHASQQVLDTVEKDDFVSLTLRTVTGDSQVNDDGTMTTPEMIEWDYALAALPSYDSEAKSKAKSCEGVMKARFANVLSQLRNLRVYWFASDLPEHTPTSTPTHN